MTAPRSRAIPARTVDIVLSTPWCRYCGAYAGTVDHVLPFSRGGTHDLSNLAPCCSPCNTEKGDFTPEEWRAWRAEEGLPWPPVSRVVATLNELTAAFTPWYGMPEADARERAAQEMLRSIRR